MKTQGRNSMARFLLAGIILFLLIAPAACGPSITELALQTEKAATSAAENWTETSTLTPSATNTATPSATFTTTPTFTATDTPTPTQTMVPMSEEITWEEFFKIEHLASYVVEGFTHNQDWDPLIPPYKTPKFSSRPAGTMIFSLTDREMKTLEAAHDTYYQNIYQTVSLEYICEWLKINLRKPLVLHPVVGHPFRSGYVGNPEGSWDDLYAWIGNPYRKPYCPQFDPSHPDFEPFEPYFYTPTPFVKKTATPTP